MKDYLEKRREELSKREEGFTLMEMLIVVAIIAVLIAIAIPIFTSQLENSREATDAANIRSAYAEVTASALSGTNADGVQGNATDGWTKTVSLQQTKDGWDNESIKSGSIGSIALTGTTPKAGNTVTVKATKDGAVTLTFN